jgi:hypothetical protein
MKVHHVGIVVKDIEKACVLHHGLGYVQVGSIIEDNVQHNRLFFLKNGELLVELIEPINSSSPYIIQKI